jgi:outer membrane lipoprotein-sorting protein
VERWTGLPGVEAGILAAARPGRAGSPAQGGLLTPRDRVAQPRQPMEAEMNRVLVSVAAAVAALTWTSTARAQTADEIVEKHLAAMGGRSALSKITSQEASGTVAISTQGADFGGSIAISRKAPNKSRTYMTLDLSALGGSEMIIDQRCDGKTAYASNSLQGDREITGDQLQNMLNASFPSPLLTYKEAGAKVELQGPDKVGGRAVVVLLYTPTTGPATKMFFDAETYLLARAVTKMNVPAAGGEIEQTSDLGDYRAVDGIMQPFSVTVSSPAQRVAITLSKVEVNTALDDAIFSRPAVK